jgi:predicted phage terminase large subunit-like protein
VQIKTADDPEMLRSEGLHGCVFDEAAFMHEDTWSVVRPALADHQGWAWFITTPNRMNWFYRLFQDAKSNGKWRVDQSPTTELTVPQTELDELRSELGTFRYRQEILAEFLEAGGGFFKRDYFRYYQNGGATYRWGETSVDISKCRRKITVDLAASVKTLADYTVVTTFAITPKNQLIVLDCMRTRIEGPDQVPLIRRAYERWKPDGIHIEKVGYQLALIQAARRDGLPIFELPRDKDKVSRASLLQARMEGGDVLFPHEAPWLRDMEDELLAFPEGDHDDIVDTLSDGAALVVNNTGFRVW